MRRLFRGQGNRVFVSAMLMCAGMLATSARAATIYVKPAGSDANNGQTWDTAKKTVTAGLAAAVSGDQVWVAAGTYVERITLKNGVGLYGGFAGAEALLAERNWVNSAAILDGSAAGTVVTASNITTAGTCIDGFTIRNGKGNNGGGIYSNGSLATIANNRIMDNTAVNGGGVYHTGPGAPAIKNNVISGNLAYTSGGGIYSSIGSVVIANNVIAGNAAVVIGGTGGGGGILCNNNNQVANNTIVGNLATLGGGVYSNSAPTVSNNIVAFNSSGYYRFSGTPTLRNNCVYNPDGANYTNVTAGTGDISVDPQLTGADTGGVHLQAGSPCIDVGNDSAVQTGWVDMDGEARIQGGPDAHVDIGADEFNGVTPPSGARVVRVSTTGDDANDGSDWTLAKKTVQAAIEAAAGAGGGEVWVAAGTYSERITLKTWVHVYGGFAGTETSREQRNWNDHVAILDGGAGGSVVTVSTGGYHTNRIDGCTIRNGKGTVYDSRFYGGGVYAISSAPVIANNTITGNNLSSGGIGGGIGCVNLAAPLITHNIIKENASGSAGGQGGGGIGCYKASPVIIANTITKNTAPGQAGGAGLYSSESTIVVSRNTISGNNCGSGAAGGIMCATSSGTVSNNVIRDSVGSGIGCSGGGSLTICNNVIAGNTAYAVSDYPPNGGGIYCYVCPATIANNTIVRNAGLDGGGIYCDLTGSSATPTLASNLIAFNSSGIYAKGGAPTLQNNCVYQPGRIEYSGVAAGASDISVDPLLVADEYGEVHLQAGSPCVDAGRESVVQAGWTDLDGESRFQGAHVDIGADEFNGTPPPAFTPTVVRVSPAGDDANDGSTWALAKRTVQAGIDGLGGDSGEIWVAAGTYNERITLKPWANLYGGFAGTESTRDARDWAAQVTILDGQFGGRVVTTAPGGISGRIDGFTILHGVGTGGGIYCYYGSPAITNNTIIGDKDHAVDAVACDRAAPLIERNTLNGNSMSGVYCHYAVVIISGNSLADNTAAGILCDRSTAVITDNTISGSKVYAGIYCENTSATIASNVVSGNAESGIYCITSQPQSLQIVRNTIRANSSKGSGGGIYCTVGGAVIRNNRIVSNRAAATGGGIYCSGAAVANNAIISNTAGVGGGMECSASTLVNNTIVNNTANKGGGVSANNTTQLSNNIVAFNSSEVYASAPSPTLRNNCVYNPAGYSYSGVTVGIGDISVDPQLASVESEQVYLLAGSPCIDAGNNAAASATGLTVDVDGHARFLNDPATPDCPWAPGTCGTAPIVDMGAYEFIAGDYDRDGDLDVSDTAVFTACVSGPSVIYAGDCLKADFDRDGDVDFVDFGFFQRCFSGAGREVDPGCAR